MGGRFARLTTLLLRDGSLGADGVWLVCQGLAAAMPTPPLLELDLSGNEVCVRGRRWVVWVVWCGDHMLGHTASGEGVEDGL